MPGFEVWQSPGGLIWEGSDQEEAFLTAVECRRPGVVIEVAVERGGAWLRRRPDRGPL